MVCCAVCGKQLPPAPKPFPAFTTYNSVLEGILPPIDLRTGWRFVLNDDGTVLQAFCPEHVSTLEKTK